MNRRKIRENAVLTVESTDGGARHVPLPKDVRPRLDDVDRTLLRLLAADGRMSNKDLAERAGIAPSTCLARIRSLRERGTTVFLNSHLLGEVEATCDRVAFVKQGRTIHEMALGQPVDFIDVEMRVSPLDACLLEGLRAFGSAISQSSADILRMRVESEAALPALARWLVERGTNVYGLQPRRKSLEEWFVEVMGDQRPG